GDGLRDGRALLADRDVDALHALALLGEDRVDRDGRLARLAVADDELALAASHGRHRVDGLDAGLQWFVHRLATEVARRLQLEAAHLVGRDRALAVDRATERVDDTSDQGVAHGDREDATGRLDRATLLDVARLAQHHRTDRILVEVERQPQRAAFELEHLV